MKLTNYIRDAFINSTMNDVPKVDYSEQVQTPITEAVLSEALAEALPQFAKYLPAEPVKGAAPRSVPVVIDVVEDFVKAGWPKGQKPPKKEA